MLNNKRVTSTHVSVTVSPADRGTHDSGAVSGDCSVCSGATACDALLETWPAAETGDSPRGEAADENRHKSFVSWLVSKRGGATRA